MRTVARTQYLLDMLVLAAISSQASSTRSFLLYCGRPKLYRSSCFSISFISCISTAILVAARRGINALCFTVSVSGTASLPIGCRAETESRPPRVAPPPCRTALGHARAAADREPTRRLLRLSTQSETAID